MELHEPSFLPLPVRSQGPKHDSILCKGIFSVSNIFLWHESEDKNKIPVSLFPKFQLIPILRFQVMDDYVCFIATVDYCVE